MSNPEDTFGGPDQTIKRYLEGIDTARELAKKSHNRARWLMGESILYIGTAATSLLVTIDHQQKLEEAGQVVMADKFEATTMALFLAYVVKSAMTINEQGRVKAAAEAEDEKADSLTAEVESLTQALYPEEESVVT